MTWPLVGVFMVVAASWAPVITRFAGIVEFFQSFLGYVTMPIVVVLFGGICWRRPSTEAGSGPWPPPSHACARRVEQQLDAACR